MNNSVPPILVYNDYVLSCLGLLPHEYRYRVMNAATMTDEAYDFLKERIRVFEETWLSKNKNLILTYSPSSYVAFDSAVQLVMH